MKSCPKCWETHSDEEKRCHRCNKALVSGKTESYRKFESEVDRQVRKNLKKLAIFVGLTLLAIVLVIAGILYFMISIT